MNLQYIYHSACGRVSLGKRGGVFSVVIAGAEYGPFNWSDALAMYRRQKGTPSKKLYSVVVRHACGRSSVLSVKDRTEWKQRRYAEKHMREFLAMAHAGVVSVHIEVEHS